MDQAIPLDHILGVFAKMSQPRPDLNNDAASVKRYIDFIADYSGLVEVRLWGSRSPKKRKQHTDSSDWDLVIVWEKPTVTINPRTHSKIRLHADALSVGKEKYYKFMKTARDTSVQLYPIDEYNILKEEQNVTTSNNPK